ncbi:glycosyltransferase family 87 protein [Rosistilla oblonga]|uniref:glycosyltransferase family 87 protein n=1 Tax=Rosistilla oblonga TaxID=2527990 RepID=UPI003A975C15
MKESTTDTEPRDDAAVASTQRRRQIVSWLAAVCFLIGVVLTAGRIVLAYQTPGPFDPSRQGYCDFHNGVYFPALAFREGVSPYSAAYVQQYPVERSIPFYSPLVLALHTPLTWLPLAVAEVVYFIVSLGMLLGIAWFSVHWTTGSAGAGWRWDWFWIVASGLVFTRGGQQTLFTGYFTFELILGALLAVHYGKTHPWRSVLGLVVISCKPTFVLPIAGLMLFRGNIKAVALAGVISLVLAVACFGWLIQSGSASQMMSDIGTSQDVHRSDDYELPANTWTRIDVLAIVAKWTDWVPGDATHLVWMIGLLSPAAIVLSIYHRHNRDDGAATGLSGAIVLLTSLVAIFHQVYDVMILTPAIVAILIALRPAWDALSWQMRMFLAISMLMPALNYASSLMVLNRFQIDGFAKDVVTSLNAISLLIACVVLLVLAWNRCGCRANRVSV